MKYDTFEEAYEVAEKEVKVGKMITTAQPLEGGVRFIVEIVGVVERAEAPIILTRFR